jgi:hypothetical protein
MKTKNTAWTADEDAALAEAIKNKVSPARLSVRLQRSAASIKRRMRELGLAGTRRGPQDDKKSRVRKPINPIVQVERWLETCRFGDLASLMEFYESEATLECACTGPAVFAGQAAIQQYWAPKLRSSNPKRFSLLGARLVNGRVAIEYLSYEAKPVTMYLMLNEAGKIVQSECGPRDSNKLAA